MVIEQWLEIFDLSVVPNLPERHDIVEARKFLHVSFVVFPILSTATHGFVLLEEYPRLGQFKLTGYWFRVLLLEFLPFH